MRIIYTLIVIMCISIFTSCDDSDTTKHTDTAIDPFNNGSSERSMIVIISDLHIGANLDYAECNENRIHLINLLEKIRVSSNVKELVIGGDMLDEWFVPATTDTYDGKDQADFVKRIATANKDLFDAFNKIIQEGKIIVTYVPGNHDLAITKESFESILPGIKQARDDMQGLGTYSPIGYPQIAIEHGHRYNFFCAPDPLSNKDIAPGSIMPPGYFFTRIATLHVIQNCKTPGDTIKTVTPNQSGNESQRLAYYYWAVWKNLMINLPIENKFNEEIIVTNINGFTKTYSVNDLMPFQSTAGGFIDMTLYKNIQDQWTERQTINKVAVPINVEEAVLKAADSIEIDNQATKQYFLNPNSDVRIVVFGHTHDAKIKSSENHKGLKSIYANSGTWIDENSIYSTMNFVVITPQSTDKSSYTSVKLYNFENATVTKMAADSLQF